MRPCVFRAVRVRSPYSLFSRGGSHICKHASCKNAFCRRISRNCCRAGKGVSRINPGAKKAVEPKQAAETTEETSELLYQILDNVHDLQKNMDLLLGLQESHFEDVDYIGVDLHGLEVGVEETKDGILQSTEKNSNAVREKTDRIVGAANATISAAVGVVEAVGLVLGLGGVALLQWICGS